MKKSKNLIEEAVGHNMDNLVSSEKLAFSGQPYFSSQFAECRVPVAKSWVLYFLLISGGLTSVVQVQKSM